MPLLLGPSSCRHSFLIIHVFGMPYSKIRKDACYTTDTFFTIHMKSQSFSTIFSLLHFLFHRLIKLNLTGSYHITITINQFRYIYFNFCLRNNQFKMSIFYFIYKIRVNRIRIKLTILLIIIVICNFIIKILMFSKKSENDPL